MLKPTIARTPSSAHLHRVTRPVAISQIDVFSFDSLLFTGDLEDVAIDTMVDFYNGTQMLNVDAYQVGHHGSANGTTASLLTAMTPDLDG